MYHSLLRLFVSDSLNPPSRAEMQCVRGDTRMHGPPDAHAGRHVNIHRAMQGGDRDCVAEQDPAFLFLPRSPSRSRGTQ
jgi:hypothetical protein